jgi:long-chain acyl-CoA synthetase
MKFQTLNEIFHEGISTFPDRDLFGTKRDGRWHWMSYLQFGKEVDRVRAGLAGLGLQPGDKVAIISNNRVEWAVCAYATYGLGGAYVPMYEAQLPKEWEFIIKDCDAKIAICATDAITEKVKTFFDSCPSLKHVVSLDTKTKAEGKVTTYRKLLATDKSVPIVKVKPSDIAGLIYTSGTTGNPKGVLLSHSNIASNVSAMHELMPMNSMDRSLSFLPWAHSFGQVVELHALFSMGASLAICESVDKIIDNLAETKPTLLFSVPRIFNKIYTAVQKQISEKPPIIQNMVKTALAARKKARDGEPLDLGEQIVLAVTDKLVFAKVRARFGGRLKYAFSGGAAISREVAEFIDGLGITVYEGYGLTETSPIATCNYENNRRIGSVGKPIPGVTIKISDEGEIVVYGHNVMQGYHNRPEENAAVFTKDGGFRTGDMGRIDEDGFLYITGRIKEQYKLENGKYVVPTPLEEQLKLSPYIANVMVYGDNRPFNIALVVPNFDAVKKWGAESGVSESDPDKLVANSKVKDLIRKEVEKHCQHFKGFEEVKDFALIPQDFTTENGMLTPSLKVKRRKVIEVYQSLIDQVYANAKTKKKPAEDKDKGKTASASAQ